MKNKVKIEQTNKFKEDPFTQAYRIAKKKRKKDNKK